MGKYYIIHYMAKSDIKIGDRYGMLTIVKEVDPTIRIRGNGSKNTIWNVECLCDCGNKTVVQFSTLKKSINRGTTPSCGCKKFFNRSELEGFERDETIVNMSKEERKEVVKKMILEDCNNKQISLKTGCSESFISLLRKELGLGNFIIDREIQIGEKFGLLTIVDIDRSNTKKHKKVLCDCDCGTKNKSISYYHIKNGNTTSCGCYMRSLSKEMMVNKVIPKSIIHGDSKKESQHHYIYDLYLSAKQRCYNPNNKRYSTYGKLGITMYNEWINNYPLFKEYILTNLGERPIGKSNNKVDCYSIDRIDVTKGYEPENLRWATFVEQANNKHKL
jgi:hypothetical protein